MKRSALVLLASLLFVLPGCGTRPTAGADRSAISEDTIYHSDTSAEDCYLCGGGIEQLIPSCWGQKNVALISLNTFEIEPIEINRYDERDGHLIEEATGVVSFGRGGSRNGGFFANLMLERDRGYATGLLELYGDEKLDVDKAASFLCADCLNKILQQGDRCFGVGAICLDTKEIRLFEDGMIGFSLGDFYFDCHQREVEEGPRRLDLLIVYGPVRYAGGA